MFARIDRGGPILNRRFGASRARLGLVTLAGALVVMALVPATASASHFTNSTKACNQPGVCVLTIGPLLVFGIGIPEDDTITVELDPGTTGATFPDRDAYRRPLSAHGREPRGSDYR